MSQDIRQWARDQGLDVKDRGPLPDAVMRQWEEREAPPTGFSPNGDSAEVAPEHFGGDSPETRPEVKTSLRAWWKGRQDKGEAPKPTRPSQRRVSIENVVSYGWGMAAYAVAQNPRALPVARCLDMQAPVAGVIVNDMAKGTMLDRALQPLARAGEKGEKAAGLIGPPLLVGVITARPELFPVLRPMLKLSLMSWLEISEPAMKKVQKRAEQFNEKFGDVDIDGMIDGLFAPPPGSAWAEATGYTAEDIARAEADAKG